MRTAIDSFKRQKRAVQALIAFTVLAGVAIFIMGITQDEVRLRETGVVLSVILPVIGLLEDRIYRKSRERYLETKAAAERQSPGTPPVTAPPSSWPSKVPLVAGTAASTSQWSRPMRPEPVPAASVSDDAIDWYGLYG